MQEKALQFQRRPRAFGARRCQNRSLKKARLTHNRIAHSLAAKWINASSPEKFRQKRPGTQIALFSLSSGSNPPLDDAYKGWLKDNCDRLTSGAGGAAVTKRLRKQKAEENSKVSSLIQMFKEFVNKSGGCTWNLSRIYLAAWPTQ